jgi:hypothetical protein
MTGSNYRNVLQGLDFIVQHFHQDGSAELFPRKIMTFALGFQKEVYGKDEAMRYFAESNFIDCRIRAYPDQPALAKYLHQNEIAPDLIMMDIDRSRVTSNKAFESTLKKVKTIIHEEINGVPTILRSGNGYHVIQPIEAMVLDNIAQLKNLHEKPSETFLRFAEWYLSDRKADNNHYNTLSFRNCLLRIPGSYNSKLILKHGNAADESTQVKIVQKWDGFRPNIKLLLGNFHAYLIDKRITELRKYHELKHRGRPEGDKILWIERLLQTPITDNRKYCVWRILTPYLVNARKLEYEESSTVIHEWLKKCNSVSKLSFDPNYMIKYNIRNAKRIGYYPIGFNDLLRENPDLHGMLV